MDNSPIYWVNHTGRPGGDDDYNMVLLPRDPNTEAGVTNGLTKGNLEGHDPPKIGNTPGALLEFQAEETIDKMVGPAGQGWWRRFHSAVDSGNSNAQAIINDQDAIATGLLGLDCEHDCQTELHPVWALAIREKIDPANPNEEVWAVFVRLYGNEGGCSEDSPITAASTKPFGHYLDLVSNKFRLRVPLSNVSVTSTSGTIFSGVSKTGAFGVTVNPIQFGNEMVVTLDFGSKRPEDKPIIYGELHIKH